MIEMTRRLFTITAERFLNRKLIEPFFYVIWNERKKEKKTLKTFQFMDVMKHIKQTRLFCTREHLNKEILDISVWVNICLAETYVFPSFARLCPWKEWCDSMHSFATASELFVCRRCSCFPFKYIYLSFHSYCSILKCICIMRNHDWMFRRL